MFYRIIVKNLFFVLIIYFLVKLSFFVRRIILTFSQATFTETHEDRSSLKQVCLTFFHFTCTGWCSKKTSFGRNIGSFLNGVFSFWNVEILNDLSSTISLSPKDEQKTDNDQMVRRCCSKIYNVIEYIIFSFKLTIFRKIKRKSFVKNLNQLKGKIKHQNKTKLIYSFQILTTYFLI